MHIQWENHRGEILDKINQYDVIECIACKFKHIIPLPTKEDLIEVYRQKYYSSEKPFYLERHKEDLDWWNLVYSERYDTFEQLLPANRRRILDIGSGPGFFLLHGKERGWQTAGIEPSVQAAQHSERLGLNIIQEFLDDDNVKSFGAFDVVYMNEVLEHIPDPQNMVSLAKQLLNKDGLICIVVPNDYSPIQKVLREQQGYKPYWLAPPHHINYFNFASLADLLNSVGFELIDKAVTFPIDLFLLMGDNYVGNDKLGRECHAKRKRLDIMLNDPVLREFKIDMYSILAKHAIGRELVIYARKR